MGGGPVRIIADVGPLSTTDSSRSQIVFVVYSNMSNLDQTAAGLPDIIQKSSIEIGGIRPSPCEEKKAAV